MKKANVLLFLIGVSLFGCTSAKESTAVVISDLAVDFPVAEDLEFKPFNSHAIIGNGVFMIDDSILWYFNRSNSAEVGFCYDLNTGEKLSTIASRGKAIYEFIDVSPRRSKMTTDSIHIFEGSDMYALGAGGRTIKSFAKKDILENKIINERPFSVITCPEEIYMNTLVKLPNGSGLVTIVGRSGNNLPPEEHDINNKSVAIFDNNMVKGYQTINYDSFDIIAPKSRFEPNNLVKCSYAAGSIEVKDDNMAVFSVDGQFMLYTLDFNSGEVKNEKRYADVKVHSSSSLTNDLGAYIVTMKSNDKYILCEVSGYLDKGDKELGQNKRAIFIFDWDLNPVKRFNLPYGYKRGFQYVIQEDCSSVYIIQETEEGIVLTKADLNI